MKIITSNLFLCLKSKLIKYSYKILLILLLLIGSSSGLLAQIKWAPKGAKWYYTRPYFYGTQGSNEDCVVFESLGDTLVLGQHAVALEVHYCSGNSISTEIIRQSGDTLFYLNRGKFYMLYNFAAKAGDTITVHPGWFHPVKACLFDYDSVNGFRYKITAVDSMQISGQWLKRQTVERVGGNWDFWGGNSSSLNIVEKLGSLGYFFGRFYLFIPEEKITMLRCYSDSDIAYHNPRWTSACDLVGVNEIKGSDTLALIKQEGNDALSIQLNHPVHKADVYVFDVSGHLVNHKHLKNEKNSVSLHTLKSGIYFLRIVSNRKTQTYKFIKL